MVFAGATKYFRQILMGHEIFLGFLMGYKKMFLCTFPTFLITPFKTLSGSKHKIFKPAIKGILKNQEFLKTSKIHSGIWHMLLKIQKNKLWCVLNLLLRSLSLQWGKGYVPLWQLFFRIFYMFDSIFSEIIWVDKLR